MSNVLDVAEHFGDITKFILWRDFPFYTELHALLTAWVIDNLPVNATWIVKGSEKSLYNRSDDEIRDLDDCQKPSPTSPCDSRVIIE
jgi:hypothetical protein